MVINPRHFLNNPMRNMNLKVFPTTLSLKDEVWNIFWDEIWNVYFRSIRKAKKIGATEIVGKRRTK